MFRVTVRVETTYRSSFRNIPAATAFRRYDVIFKGDRVMVPSEVFKRHAIECKHMRDFPAIQRIRKYGGAWLKDGFGAPKCRKATHQQSVKSGSGRKPRHDSYHLRSAG